MSNKAKSQTHKKKTADAPGDDLNARLRGDLLTIASRISHDLRTPLNYIFNASEVMKEILVEKEPSAAAMADTLINSAEEMTQLLKRVSFVLRASLNPGETARFSMHLPASAALQRLELQIRKKNSTVKEPSSWPEVTGVESWLEIIWWNLIMNALVHGGEKARVELGWDEQKESFRFWVRDNGPGVAEERRKNLFKSFDSLHETDEFAGLGLAIVDRLVKLQGGACGHESPKTGGSLFYFELPIKPSKPSQKIKIED
jgi:signal transduction histidine kinase